MDDLVLLYMTNVSPPLSLPFLSPISVRQRIFTTYFLPLARFQISSEILLGSRRPSPDSYPFDPFSKILDSPSLDRTRCSKDPHPSPSALLHSAPLAVVGLAAAPGLCQGGLPSPPVPSRSPHHKVSTPLRPVS